MHIERASCLFNQHFNILAAQGPLEGIPSRARGCIPPPPPPGGRGGDDSSIKMTECVCWGSENVPILKDALGENNLPILKGSSTYFIPILWCNIKLKCIIPKSHS